MKTNTKYRRKTTIYTIYNKFANIFIVLDDENVLHCYNIQNGQLNYIPHRILFSFSKIRSQFYICLNSLKLYPYKCSQIDYMY